MQHSLSAIAEHLVYLMVAMSLEIGNGQNERYAGVEPVGAGVESRWGFGAKPIEAENYNTYNKMLSYRRRGIAMRILSVRPFVQQHYVSE